MWMYLAGLLFLLMGFLIFAVFSIRSGIFIKGITKSPTGNYLFTFDDGPHPEFTSQILDLLKENEVKALFFCIGKNVKLYPELARRIVAEGHSIGNHTYNHEVRSTYMDASQYKKEINDTTHTIEQATGVKCTYFRPPFGVTNPSIATAVRSSGLTMMAWNIRTFDTVAKTSEIIYNRIVTGLNSDSIVLMHDTNPLTVEALKKFFSKQ